MLSYVLQDFNLKGRWREVVISCGGHTHTWKHRIWNGVWQAKVKEFQSWHVLSFEELSVKIWSLFYWAKMSIFTSNPKRRFCKASNLCLLLELKTDDFKPKRTRTNLDTKLLEAKHISRLKFAYLGLPNFNSKQTFSNMCGLPFAIKEEGVFR